MAIVSGSTVKKRVSFHFNPASLLPLSFVTVIQFLCTFFFLSVLSVRIVSVSEFEIVYTMLLLFFFSFFSLSQLFSNLFFLSFFSSISVKNKQTLFVNSFCLFYLFLLVCLLFVVVVVDFFSLLLLLLNDL